MSEAPLRVVVLKTGDPPDTIRVERGSFFDWIVAASPAGMTWHEVDARESLPPLTDFDACVITGSSASVTERAEWMLALERAIVELHRRRVYILGICFGHQIVAQALGGNVVKNPIGREMGTVITKLLERDMLFDSFESECEIHATHVDTVGTLPPGARVLARSALEKTAAYAIGDHVRCVQFHPEFDDDILQRYVAVRHDVLVGEGIDPAQVVRTIKPTRDGLRIMENFFRLVQRAHEQRRAG